MTKIDVTILTDHRYVNPENIDAYVQNVLDEDQFVKDALERRGLVVHRTNWDDPTFDWSSTKYVLFRTTWDYFERFDEFSIWLGKVDKQSKLINSKELIYWNIDKHYLVDLKNKGINIPRTVFIEAGNSKSLAQIVNETDWEEFILKPAVSGGAYNTFRFERNEVDEYEQTFQKLNSKDDFLVQEYQKQITTKGEVAHMVFGGVYSHSVLKCAKDGDYRVQDDFGGTLHDYHPNEEEIEFVEKTVAACDELPVYARVDVLWDNDDNLALGEIELIEPELWFRRDENAADLFAEQLIKMNF